MVPRRIRQHVSIKVLCSSCRRWRCAGVSILQQLLIVPLLDLRQTPKPRQGCGRQGFLRWEVLHADTRIEVEIRRRIKQRLLLLVGRRRTWRRKRAAAAAVTRRLDGCLCLLLDQQLLLLLEQQQLWLDSHELLKGTGAAKQLLLLVEQHCCVCCVCCARCCRACQAVLPVVQPAASGLRGTPKGTARHDQPKTLLRQGPTGVVHSFRHLQAGERQGAAAGGARRQLPAAVGAHRR